MTTVFLVLKSYDINGYYSADDVDKVFARQEDAEAYVELKTRLVEGRNHLIELERKYDAENPFPRLPNWNKEAAQKTDTYHRLKRNEEILKIWQSENQPFPIEEVSAGWSGEEYHVREMKVE